MSQWKQRNCKSFFLQPQRKRKWQYLRLVDVLKSIQTHRSIIFQALIIDKCEQFWKSCKKAECDMDQNYRQTVQRVHFGHWTKWVESDALYETALSEKILVAVYASHWFKLTVFLCYMPPSSCLGFLFQLLLFCEISMFLLHTVPFQLLHSLSLSFSCFLGLSRMLFS